jgi:hypothetical protein
MHIPRAPMKSYWEAEWLFPPTGTKVSIGLPGTIKGPSKAGRAFFLALPAQFDRLVERVRPVLDRVFREWIGRPVSRDLWEDVKLAGLREGGMPELSHTLIGEFIDAVVEDGARAEALLSEHPDLIHARWIHDETVLHFLAIEGFAEGVRFLAAHGADVNAVNEFRDSALMDVSVLGLDVMADILLRHGANPNANSDTRENALHAAVRSGNPRLVSTTSLRDIRSVPQEPDDRGPAHFVETIVRVDARN